MYAELLPFLCCPACRAALRDESVKRGDELFSGSLYCSRCAAHYPLRDGILDLLGPPNPPTAAQIANELPFTALVYEGVWRPMSLTLLSGEPFPYERELPLILDRVGVVRGGLYLDIACANGLYARALARALRGRNGIVAGIDHSLPMLREAQRRAYAAGVRVNYIRARAQNLPFASGAAAGVTIGGSLNEIGDVAACIAEARRTLMPDGRFVSMSLAQASSLPGRLTQAVLAPGGVRFFTTPELLALLTRAGLQQITLQQYGIVVFAAGVAVELRQSP